MLKLRKNKKGFTLVELIVVIAIMAILAGTVAGVVVSTQQNAKNSSAASGAKSLANQLVLLLGAPSDWEEELPPQEAEQTEICYVEDGAATYIQANIVAALTADENYANAIKTDAAPKAGTNQYRVYVSTVKDVLGTGEDATACIAITFDTLGAGKKYNNIYIITMGADDQFKVAESYKILH